LHVLYRLPAAAAAAAFSQSVDTVSKEYEATTSNDFTTVGKCVGFLVAQTTLTTE
jgi:hypothetical protein